VAAGSANSIPLGPQSLGPAEANLSVQLALAPLLTRPHRRNAAAQLMPYATVRLRREILALRSASPRSSQANCWLRFRKAGQPIASSPAELIEPYAGGRSARSRVSQAFRCAR